MIKTILFDLDGTLIDSLEANAKHFQNIFLAAGYPIPTIEEYSRVFHLPMWDGIQMLTKGSRQEMNRIWKIVQELEYPVKYLKSAAGAGEVVRVLSREYTLGIVSSRRKDGIEKYLKFSNLRPYFRKVISFEDTKNHKPHPEPLQIAMRRLFAKPAATVYIGDAETDMQACAAAGVQFIHFGEEPLDGAKHSIKSFKEITGLIDTL